MQYEFPNQNTFRANSPTKEIEKISKAPFTNDNLVNFDINSYPFPNSSNQTGNLLRSTVNLKLSNEQLRKLMKFNHPNIINILKITKGRGKWISTDH